MKFNTMNLISLTFVVELVKCTVRVTVSVYPFGCCTGDMLGQFYERLYQAVLLRFYNIPVKITTLMGLQANSYSASQFM